MDAQVSDAGRPAAAFVNESEDSPAGSEPEDGAQEEPPPKRVRGGGATGLLDERYRPAFVAKHTLKALHHLARVNDRAGAHFCLVVCTETGDVLSCMPYVSGGLKHLPNHINVPQSCEIALSRYQQDVARSKLQYGDQHKPFGDCSLHLRRRIVSSGFNAVMPSRRQLHPFNGAARAVDAAGSAAAQPSTQAGEQQLQPLQGDEGDPDAQSTTRQRGIAAAKAVRLDFDWYPAEVPYANPVDTPHQLTENDISKLFSAMISAATDEQVLVWLKLQKPGTLCRDSELDKLCMDGALHHQRQVIARAAEAAAGPPVTAPASNAAHDGTLMLDDVSASALATAIEEGTFYFN